MRDVRELSTNKMYGYIVTNPPYGERLNELEEVEELTRLMSNKFEMLDTWSKYVFTAFEDFEKFYNRKSTKNRKLYNGKLRCYFYQYWGPKPPRKKD